MLETLASRFGLRGGVSFRVPSAKDEAGSEELPRIRLSLTNIWEWMGEDEQDFRDEE